MGPGLNQISNEDNCRASGGIDVEAKDLSSLIGHHRHSPYERVHPGVSKFLLDMESVAN